MKGIARMEQGTAHREPSRYNWRIAAVAIIAALGLLSIAAYATYISLPGKIKVAPASLTVHSAGSLPPEVQALEAQTAALLFDRDTTTAHIAYAEQSIDAKLERSSDIQSIKVYGPSPYELTVQAQQGSAWTSIAGLNKLKLDNLPVGWNTLAATQAVTSGALRFILTPASGKTTSSGGLPEIEIWAAGEHGLLNGPALLAAMSGSTPTGTTAQPQPAQARAYSATPVSAVVGRDGQSFSFTLDRPAANLKRAWLTYEAYGLAHWVSPVRRINGQAMQGGAFTFTGSDWTQLTEPIQPTWLLTGSNRIDFTLPANAAGTYSVRNVRIVTELDDGNNFIARASVGVATSKTTTESEAAALIDGDLATGWSPYTDPRSKGGSPTLTLYFDKPTQLDTLSLNLANTLNGTLSVDLLVGGQWQSAGLPTLNGKKLTAGWNALNGFAAVPAEALRITFLNGTGSPAEIREIAASGSGSGPAFVPSINIAYPDAGQFYGRQAYIRGFLSVPDNGAGMAEIAIGAQSVPNSDGSFGLVVSKDDVGLTSQADAEPWQVEVIAVYPNGQKLTQIVKLTQSNDASKAHGLLPNVLNPGFADLLVGGDASLDIGPDALDKPLAIKITPLADKDLPALDPGMTNVTPAPRRGYRFTPHGAHFKKDVKVTIPFNPALIPAGLTENDVKTYYFDTERGHWVELARYKIDSNKKKVTSLTNHFTDMINATLTVPDHPETVSFNATQIKDIKAADPGAGISLIEPPKANNMGDARLSYPIEIPQGRQGMQPQLGISYNSSGGNGWLGQGWDLSVPSITIDTRWGVPRYDAGLETETYSLNGEMLTPVAHRGALQNRTAEKVFHTRVEGGFRKIVRHGNTPANYWWEVTDKNGVKNYYGGDGAKQDAGTTLGGNADGGDGVFRWALRKTIDLHGNNVNYHYSKVADTGVNGGAVPGYQLYIKTIAYTGQGTSDGPYTVNFVRDRDLKEPRRTDVSIDARGGFKQVTADLLRKVEIKYNGKLVRSYALVYQAGAFNKTLLDHVVQYGSDGSSEFNRHSFAYYDEARNAAGNYHGFAQAADWNVGADSISALELFGNGSASALGGNRSESVGGAIYVGIGPISGDEHGNQYSKGMSGGFKAGFNQGRSETLLAMADMNGDGLADKVFKKGSGFWYRPNLSGPQGNARFGDPIALTTLPALGTDSVTSTTLGGEAYFGLSALGDVNDSLSQSDSYLTDVNGDGITDLVAGGRVLFGYIHDGVPTFSANSSDTHVPVGAGSLITDGLLADSSAIEAKRARDFPLLDTVHRWVAPYDGVIKIDAPVALLQDMSPARAKYDGADGVRVAIQLEEAELWSTRIQATDYASKTPQGVHSVSVKKGDRLYFRVQSIFDGAYDRVSWNPSIAYVNVDTIQTDENLLTPYRYSAAGDFVLAGRPETTLAPLNGTLHLAGLLEKTGPTSDDVTLLITRNGVDVVRRVLGHADTVSDNLSLDIVVSKLDKLEWRFLVDSPIDVTRVKLTPQAWYTAATGDDGNALPVVDTQNRHIMQLNPNIDTELYPENDLLAPRTGYVYKKSAQIPLAITLSSSVLADKEHLPVIFTVKRAGDLVAKLPMELVGELDPDTHQPKTVTQTLTLKVDVKPDDKLYFDFSVRTPDGLSKLDAHTVLVDPTWSSDGWAGTPVLSALNSAPLPAALFPMSFRGWAVFGYNGNGSYADTPIAQTELKISEGYTYASARAYPFKPAALSALWGGLDDGAWVKAAEMSSSRLGLDDIRMPHAQQFAGAGAVPRISHSSSNGFSVSGISKSNGSSASLLDFQDLNGDRFPDVLSQGGVQFTGMSGGLEATRRGSVPDGVRNSSNDSYGVSTDGVASIPAGIATAKAYLNPTGKTPAAGAKNEPTEPSLGLGGSLGGGSSATEGDLIDVNGDGLPDKVYQDGAVALNLGYRFAAREAWGGGNINDGQTLNAGVNMGFGLFYGSWAGGLNLGIGTSRSDETYVDINGDGLPDKISGSGPYSVRLNTGAGFAPAISWPGGQGGIARDKNITLGGGVYVTFAIPIPAIPPAWRLVISPAVNYSTSMGRPELAFRDLDGDGYTDQAYSRTDNELSVALNPIARTNLLKEIKRPLGASINLDYTRDGNSYPMPQSRWVMNKVTVNDGFAGDGADVLETTYQYKGGYYERYERDFYGYKTVTEEQRDHSNHAIYRKVVSSYLNGNYYAKGLQAEQQTFDGSGNIYLDTRNTYLLRDLASGAEIPPANLDGSTNAIAYASNTLFPMLTKTERNFFEGGKGSKGSYTTHVYDDYGNITRFADAGDVGSSDDVVASIGYSLDCKDSSYVIGKPLTIEVRGAGKLMRSRTGSIDCSTGNLTQLSQDLGNGSAAVTDLVYEANGNLKRITGPANLKGQRYSIDYAYDSAVATYVSSVTDSFGYSSAATYNYNYGKPLTTTDLNNNVISYVYDNYGRTTSIKGPYEQAGTNHTLVFAYHPEAAVPYATTQHLNLDAQGKVQSPIETVLFTDGLKRVLQTKKSIAENGTARLAVSGRVLFDAYGRSVKQYYPVSEALGQGGSFNPAFDSIAPTQTEYDVLDRSTNTTLPDGTTTSIEYGFGSDRSGANQFKTTVRDANGKQKESYRDVRELITAVKEYNHGNGIWTSYAYDPLKQIVEVIDAKGNLTQATYDNLGRRTTLANPDTGKTVTVYDTASNVVQKITANLAKAGKAINYDYDYNRLQAIHYPDNKGNDVSYEYGAANLNNGLNQIGRLIKVTDASGSEEREYGKLGETVKEIRTIASHTQGNSATSPEVYTTQYKYDTFGRILTLTLPDSEIVTYSYDAGGNLDNFAGDKPTQGAGPSHTQYLQTLHYDKFEQRTYLKLGNGVETNYSYDPKNRRFNNLLSQGTVAGRFQNLNYRYDKVGNILGLQNDTAIPAPGGMGGPTAQSYGYDDLYRLTSAKGTFQSATDKTRNYQLSMGYDDIHNIVAKTQLDTLSSSGNKGIEQKATSYDWSYAYSGQQPHAPTHIGNHTYSYDANGNQLGWTDDTNGTRRIIRWDEDNRISEIDDNGERSHYTYDNQGQRVIKETKQGETVYVNQYYVVRNRSIVSKHLFAGSSRLVTELVMGTAQGNGYQGSGSNPTSFNTTTSSGNTNSGQGAGKEHSNQGNNNDHSNNGNAYAYGQNKDNPGQGNANNQGNNANSQGHGNSNSLALKGEGRGEGANLGTTNLPGNSEKGLENALANGKGNKYGIYKRLDRLGYSVDASGDIVVDAADGGATPITGDTAAPVANGQSEFTYYYHPDHLGSTGYVTDANGKLYEHLEYFPFGETWVQEHSNTLRTPYLFTGKELDQETGLYYFGARYYDPRTSVWQSADPILGSYLIGNPSGGVYSPSNLSLYMYTSNNPIVFTDPDGRFKLPVHERIVRNALESSTHQIGKFATRDLVYGATSRADIVGAASDYHFDGRSGYKAVQDTWSSLNASIKDRIGRIGGGNKALGGYDVTMLGIDLHTVSDFYSHSNYAELYIEHYKGNNNGAMPTSIPIYDDGVKDKGFNAILQKKLRTGEFNLSDNEFYDLNPFGGSHTGPNSHAQMNKDYASTPAGVLAEKAATQHVEKILNEIQ